LDRKSEGRQPCLGLGTDRQLKALLSVNNQIRAEFLERLSTNAIYFSSAFTLQCEVLGRKLAKSVARGSKDHAHDRELLPDMKSKLHTIQPSQWIQPAWLQRVVVGEDRTRSEHSADVLPYELVKGLRSVITAHGLPCAIVHTVMKLASGEQH